MQFAVGSRYLRTLVSNLNPYFVDKLMLRFQHKRNKIFSQIHFLFSPNRPLTRKTVVALGKNLTHLSSHPAI